VAAPALAGKKAELERKIRAREFVFGIQDGLISTVGLLSGVSAATHDPRVVVLTGLAAGVTGAALLGWVVGKSFEAFAGTGLPVG
jgi:VIT1/CCC1 family predicted Fe2+/Mn2+ transporter